MFSIGVILLINAVICASAEPKLRFVGEFAFHKPAFVTAHPSPAHANVTDLILSSFGVSVIPGKPAPDRVEFIPDIASALKEKRFESQRVGGPVVWPNEVNLVDRSHLIVPGGFLVPGKRGHISALDYVAFRRKTDENLPWRKLVEVKEGFFHRVEKMNVLNRAARAPDTGERMVTCRGWKSVFGKSGGEMVYLEPNHETGEFTLKKIADGCDCFFIPVDFNGDGIMEFVVPEFFSEKLSLVWTEDPNGDYSKQEMVRQRVIDGNLGAAFDVQAVDLDDDGMMEVIVTNHQNGKKGVLPSLFAYHVVKPEQRESGNEDQIVMKADDETLTSSPISEFMLNLKFHRYTLSEDFPVINRAFMSAAPGGAQAIMIHEDPNHPGYNPYPALIVSGDGSEKAYLLTRRHQPHMNGFVPTKDSGPDDGSDKNWEYDQIIFHDCKGTTGGIYVGDVDGDGWSDVFVPCYDRDYVAVYTFAP